MAESTSQDYWNIIHPSAIPTMNPELRFTGGTHEVLDFEDPQFSELYQSADVGTKKAMLKGLNNEDAISIYNRRQIFNTSMSNVAEDGLATQVAMGAVPAVFSYSNLLPLGAFMKTAQIAKTTSKLQSAAVYGAVGAATGAVANVADEALFDLQGMPTNYLGAGAMGAIFGGGLGIIGGSLVGPNQKVLANSIDPMNDTYSADFSRDPYISMSFDDNGVPQIQPMKKSLVDKVPFIGEWLRSDVHTVMQGDVSTLRSYMYRIANPSVSLRDMNGNLMPSRKAGVDIIRESQGIHNNLIKETQDSYHIARETGYKGSIEDFSSEVFQKYREASVKQRNEANLYFNEAFAKEEATMKADYKIAVARIDADEAYLRGDNGKLIPFDDSILAKAERGEIPQDKIVMKKQPKKVRDKLKTDLKDNYQLAVSNRKKEVLDEWYANNEVKFGDDAIGKAAESYKNYFRNMLEKSQKLGIEELKGINKNRLYAPVVYDFKKIRSGKLTPEQVKSEIREGLLNDVRNRNMTTEELTSSVDSIYTKLSTSSFSLDYLNPSFLVKELPFGTHLKQRKLYLSEAHMPNITRSNFDDVSGAYHYKMSHRQGLQFAFGSDDIGKIKENIDKELLAQGSTPDKKLIAAFDRSVQDLAGTLRMNQLADTPAWTFTRNLTSYNTLRLGGGFGGNQAIEMASVIMMSPIKTLMSGRLFRSLKNASDLLYMKNGRHDTFAKYLIDSGYMEETLHTSRVNRYADTEQGFNSGFLENSLNWMNDKLMKYNGMRYFMGVMEDYVGSTVVNQLKEGKIPAKRLARWGLTTDEAVKLQTKLSKVTTDKWDLSRLSELERDQLQLAISRGINELVIQGESIHLPAWMKAPGPFTKVLTQFMRFPMIAQEILLRRGFAEEQAQMIAGSTSAIMMYISLKYLREQASYSLGMIHEADMKYDYDNYTEDDWMRVTGEALNYTAPLGMMTSVVNYGAIIGGAPELGREWVSKNGMMSFVGPSGSLAEDTIQVIRAIVDGEATDERTFRKVKSMMPYATMPIIKEGLDVIVEELGD